MTLSLILMVTALILFIVAAVGVAVGRLNVMAAGLACYVAALLSERF